MAELKRATIYLDSHAHTTLKVRAASEGTTVSALVNEAVRRLLSDSEAPIPGVRVGRLSLDWAGALADLKDELTSTALQHSASEWRRE